MVSFLFELARETHFITDERRSIWALDLATATLAAAGMIWHLNTVPPSRMGDYFAVTDLLVDLFWDSDPLSMVAEPIAYFDQADWDIAARLNLDLARAEYEQFLGGLGLDKECLRDTLHKT